MQVRPLHSLTPAEITDLAHAAADRREPLATANPFDPKSDSYVLFAIAYRERDRDLDPEYYI